MPSEPLDNVEPTKDELTAFSDAVQEAHAAAMHMYKAANRLVDADYPMVSLRFVQYGDVLALVHAALEESLTVQMRIHAEKN